MMTAAEIDGRGKTILHRTAQSQVHNQLNKIATNRISAIVIAFAALVAGYSVPNSHPLVYSVFIPLLILQLYQTRMYRDLIRELYRIRLLRSNIVYRYTFNRWFRAASCAVTDTYFFLFLLFDLFWLLKFYIQPIRAETFGIFVARMQVGPLEGIHFLVFTLLFWYVYLILFVYGRIAMREIQTTIEFDEERRTEENTAEEISPSRETFYVNVPVDGGNILLQGMRLPRYGKQPVILWPGFFQNGYVYDLIPQEISLAEYLWEKQLDIWIIHSRGTCGSGGSDSTATLDDYAAYDIPAVIRSVKRATGHSPIYVGHSQGGITAVMSLMGAVKKPDGFVILSDHESAARQNMLKGIVTIGSFLDMTYYEKPLTTHLIASQGIRLKVFGFTIFAVNPTRILTILRLCNYVRVPLSTLFRMHLLKSALLRILLYPIYLVFDSVARSKHWNTLYCISNVSVRSRRHLFFKTIEGTFHGIINQFYSAVKNEAMLSMDGGVDYSKHYDRITLPCSIVGLERDDIIEPVMMKKSMYEKIGSEKKYYSLLRGLGHEDCFMNPLYFSSIYCALQNVLNYPRSVS